MEDARNTREPQRFHRRVAHRPLCRAYAARLIADEAKRERWELGLAYGGLLAKTLFYTLLFVWAARTPLGAGALQGVVAADVLTFLILGAFRIPFDGFEVTMDGAFEVGLVLLFVARGALFDIPTDVEFAATSLLFFLLFVPIRVLLWGVDQVIDKK
ncbi:MAG: hypothetical protein ACYS0E_10645 [Planctomycetota bacterium]